MMCTTHAVGFDVGTLNSFVSYATKQGLQTIHDDYGDRRIPTCICFINGRRLVGMSAKMQHESVRVCTIWNFTRLLGRRYESLTLEERRSLPFACRETIGGRVGIEVTYLQRVWILLPEQLMAIQLQYLKSVTEKTIANLVRSVVLSVPVFYTDAQRRAVRDAAHIAGISRIRLISDTTAIATAYGFCKDNVLAITDSPQHVAFVSIGYRHTQVAICAITKGTTRILATAYDDDLGGRDFDQVIFDHFRGILERKYHTKLEYNSSAWNQLLKECEQLKVRMSANNAALPIKVDGLVKRTTVPLSMRSSDFEVLSEKLLARFYATLMRCLVASKLQTTEIQAVELVGGCCRIPGLRKAAAMVFGHEATTTLNADEAVARGCAIQAAMTSAGFDVRYRVIEPEVQRDSKFPDVPALTNKEISDLRATEMHMFLQDQEQTKRSAARNALEEYVYATKSRFEGLLKDTVTKEERALLDETESWICVGALERDSELYQDRLAELREVVARVEKRHRLAKTNGLLITTYDRKSPIEHSKRSSKQDQVRRSMRYTINGPIGNYTQPQEDTEPRILPARKPPQSVVLEVAEHKVPVRERQKSESSKSRSPEVVPRRRFVRSATMDRTHVTGQLNCYSSQDRAHRSSMVNLIVNFFEFSPRHRTPIYPDYVVPDERATSAVRVSRRKPSPMEPHRHSMYSTSPSQEAHTTPSTSPERPLIKAIPIMDTLRNGPEVPPYESVVPLLDSIRDYRMAISTESRQLYEVLDRYLVILRRQLQLHQVTHGFDLTLREIQQIDTLIAVSLSFLFFVSYFYCPRFTLCKTIFVKKKSAVWECNTAMILNTKQIIVVRTPSQSFIPIRFWFELCVSVPVCKDRSLRRDFF
ncbi:unnamed protein product [Echinostoma caproni]|uniref:Heat shock protein n=1 Tax=Echinostoma caproni TaxID=27848 RepID=A0A183AGZ9_9TREM|nr:unnamed protein product [Echinostoma caproni]